MALPPDINNVIGSVSTILTRLYGTAYTQSNAQKNVSAIAFAGAILGMWVLGPCLNCQI